MKMLPKKFILLSFVFYSSLPVTATTDSFRCLAWCAAAGLQRRVACGAAAGLGFGLRIANCTLKWFVMQDAGGAFEEAVDVAAPLREERAVAKIFHVRVERGPDVGEHVLVGMLDAALHARGDAAGMLANNIQSLENTLS